MKKCILSPHKREKLPFLDAVCASPFGPLFPQLAATALLDWGAALGLTDSIQPLFIREAREKETSPKSVPFEEQGNTNWESTGWVFEVTLYFLWTVEILVQPQRKVDLKVRKLSRTSSPLIMFFSVLLILN